jgi:hypothetical protein
MKSSPSLTGTKFRPKLMLQVWEGLLNALQKNPKTLTELANIAVGPNHCMTAKETEYDLGHCQTDSDPEP